MFHCQVTALFHNIVPLQHLGLFLAQEVKFTRESLEVLHDVIAVKESYISLSLAKAPQSTIKAVIWLLVWEGGAEILTIFVLDKKSLWGKGPSTKYLTPLTLNILFFLIQFIKY